MSNDMRKLMEAVTSVPLKEDYQDRVDAAVARIEKGGPLAQSELRFSILDAAQMLKVVELKFGKDSRQFKEFVTDVTKALKAKGLVKRKEAKSKAPYSVMAAGGYFDEKVPVTHKDIQALGYKMQSAAGDAFPDGDPNDMLSDYFKQKGWDTYDAFQKLVPVAAKEYLGTPDYSTYLANMWDDVYGDAKSDADHGNDYMYNMLGGDGAQNPWR